MTENEINQLWEKYYPKIYGYFYKRVSNLADVDDLSSTTANAFFETLLDTHKLDKIHQLESYLFKIAHNQLVNFIKFKSKQPTLIGLTDQFDISPEAQQARSENYESQISAIFNFAKNCLSDEENKILELNLKQELNSIEIGQKLNLKPNTVRQKLKRIIAKLKKNKQFLQF
jgi:RNA polymerase sigma factor (sigma-70 family)